MNENYFKDLLALEAKMSQVQGLLMSRAAVLLKIGKAEHVSAFYYGASINFEIKVKGFDDSLRVEFNRDDKPFNEDELNSVLQLLDKVIAEARKEAQYTIGVISNWEA